MSFSSVGKLISQKLIRFISSSSFYTGYKLVASRLPLLLWPAWGLSPGLLYRESSFLTTLQTTDFQRELGHIVGSTGSKCYKISTLPGLVS